jgi:hypothetical protein
VVDVLRIGVVDAMLLARPRLLVVVARAALAQRLMEVTVPIRSRAIASALVRLRGNEYEYGGMTDHAMVEVERACLFR